MTINETVTITETAPDGTETVVEITTTKADDSFNESEPTLVEEVFEALLDDGADDAEYDVEAVEAEYSVAETTEETGDAQAEDLAFADSYQVDETIPSDPSSFAPFVAPAEETSPTYSASETTNTENTTADETSQIEEHAQAARDAQEAADEFVAHGDYAAAAEAREAAENEAWQAGDNSMLGTSDSSDLEYAAYQQENAEYHQEQQAIHAQQGDYEAAREDASNAAYATSDADFYAGGDDHTGQAKAEEAQMDWAVYHEDIAENNAFAAEQYAAQGDFDKAEIYAESAADEQVMADYHGDLGEHGGDMAVYDASSEVSSGGSYDSYDTSTVADTSTDYSTE